MRLLFVFLVAAAIVVGTFWAGQFGYGPFVITNEYEYSLVTRLGNPRATISGPKVSLRWPFIEDAATFDKRLQLLNGEPMPVQSGNKEMVVDYYAIWRIVDPLEYRRAYPGGKRDAEGNIGRKLTGVIIANISRLPISDVLSRGQVIDDLENEMADLKKNGVEIMDVRINRTELPKEAQSAAFDRMREQRRAVARESRAKGDREAREIRAKAERQARTTLAEARAQAEITRGEGDAEAAAIYAAAYGRDPEFYAFVRSLEAYRKSLGERTTMVLEPDHEFFRYMNPKAAAEPPAAAPAETP